MTRVGGVVDATASSGARIALVVLPAKVRGDLVVQKVADEASGIVGFVESGGNLLAGHLEQETAIAQVVDADCPNDGVESRPQSGTAVHGARLSSCVEIELVPEVVSATGLSDAHGGHLGSTVSHGLVLGVESGVSGCGTLTAVGTEESVICSVDDDGTESTEGTVGVLGAGLDFQSLSHPISTGRVRNVVGETGSSSVGVIAQTRTTGKGDGEKSKSEQKVNGKLFHEGRASVTTERD